MDFGAPLTRILRRPLHPRLPWFNVRLALQLLAGGAIAAQIGVKVAYQLVAAEVYRWVR